VGWRNAIKGKERHAHARRVKVQAALKVEKQKSNVDWNVVTMLLNLSLLLPL